MYGLWVRIGLIFHPEIRVTQINIRGNYDVMGYLIILFDIFLLSS